MPNARSSATLGEEREGTGIVIDEQGLVLTIGYLIVEADEVNLVDQRGRTLPARVVGYDHATGLGLVRAVVPIGASPLPFGESGKLAERDPVMIVNHEGADDLTFAYVVSRRPFTGNWEYMLDQAIFTSPPTTNWSGAALIGKDLKLVGVGSLIVREAATGDGTLPGNMFVPIDILKPILADLVKTGRRAGPAAAVARRVRRRSVRAGSSSRACRRTVPATRPESRSATSSSAWATTAFARRPSSTGRCGDAAAPATDIPLRVLQGVDVKELSVHSIDRIEYFRPSTTY